MLFSGLTALVDFLAERLLVVSRDQVEALSPTDGDEIGCGAEEAFPHIGLLWFQNQFPINQFGGTFVLVVKAETAAPGE